MRVRGWGRANKVCLGYSTPHLPNLPLFTNDACHIVERNWFPGEVGWDCRGRWDRQVNTVAAHCGEAFMGQHQEQRRGDVVH